MNVDEDIKDKTTEVSNEAREPLNEEKTEDYKEKTVFEESKGSQEDIENFVEVKNLIEESLKIIRDPERRAHLEEKLKKLGAEAAEAKRILSKKLGEGMVSPEDTEDEPFIENENEKIASALDNFLDEVGSLITAKEKEAIENYFRLPEEEKLRRIEATRESFANELGKNNEEFQNKTNEEKEKELNEEEDAILKRLFDDQRTTELKSKGEEFCRIIKKTENLSTMTSVEDVEKINEYFSSLAEFLREHAKYDKCDYLKILMENDSEFKDFEHPMLLLLINRVERLATLLEGGFEEIRTINDLNEVSAIAQELTKQFPWLLAILGGLLAIAGTGVALMKIILEDEKVQLITNSLIAGAKSKALTTAAGAVIVSKAAGVLGLYGLFLKLTSEKTRDEWIERLTGAKVPGMLKAKN
ncbi:MAG: hypothetical protein WC178_01030 [Candidatus Paceibacterota bacterium]